MSLGPREPTSFASQSKGTAVQAATEQDTIGWYHFIKGKVAKAWEQTQHSYYMTKGLSKSGRSWAAGLVTQLYTLVHNQWLYRNGVLHETDAQGLRIKEGEALENSINTQFELGIDGLDPLD